ncbi:MAG TPA: PQQ-dependent sugar dehydrogenase, partial [Pyrinomonadaceae bacterium]|nr:PQQ-dependent sugar dehydrogenase [Pyrinomonadaceae bacterium]
MTNKRTLLFLGLIVIFVCGRAYGQSDTIRLQPFLTGLSSPVFVTSANDGTNRLFVVEQGGTIKVVQPGSNTVTNFVTIPNVLSGGERGLLGLAFHPQYSSNRRFFVYYTRSTDGANEIAEFQTLPSNPNQANPTPVRIILSIPDPFSNHNGGTILFGPNDGYLYLGTGDGGSGNDPGNRAQNINELLGKFLRIDINTPVGQVPAYNIPPSNPYAGATAGADEIYAVGLRNPYRFSFDRGGTRQLWVGDVGQNAVEEVDIITLGGNYGWRVYEGTQCTNLDPTLCNPIAYLPPVFEYNNVGSARCAITGGHIYRGTLKTFPTAAYIYADYCTGEILQWFNNTQTLRLDTPRQISGFGEDDRGELYVAGLGAGTVEKIVRPRSNADFDGDRRTDISVFRPSNGAWYILNSGNQSSQTLQFGLNGDIAANEDVDGDLTTDIGVFRPSDGTWWHFRSSNSTVSAIAFGMNGDVPAAADYDGDAMADLAVFRPSTGAWWIRRTTDPNNFLFVQFGANGDIPVAGDYDADGRSDIGVWRPSNGAWYTY